MRFTPWIALIVVGACGTPVEWLGTVQAHTTIVTSSIGGRVKTLAVGDGDHVARDQVLVVLEAGELDTQRAIAQAQLDNVITARDALKPARQARGASARAPHPDELHAADAEVAIARAHIDELDARLSELKLRSPSAARVETLDLRLGEVIAPHGVVATLLEDGQPLSVHADVPVAQIDRIAIGDTVMIRVAPYPDETFLGKVEHIEHARTCAVQIGLVSGNAELRAGMPATILVRQ